MKKLRIFITENIDLTPIEIAEKYGCTPQTVYTCAKRAGIRLKRGREKANRFDTIIKENYGKLPSREIAELIGQNRTFVQNRITYLQLAPDKEKCTWYQPSESEYFNVSALKNWLVEEGVE